MVRLLEQARAGLDGEVECRIGRATDTFDEHALEVELCTEAGSWFVELAISIRGPQPPVMATAIALSLVGIPAEVWHLQPGAPDLIFHATLTFDQLARADQPAWLEAPDRPAHIVLSKYLPQALVTGNAVRALCGLAFSPTETGESARARDVCPLCTVVMAIATSLLEPTA